jgi:glycosyltransferase involved in cell wall biosynthesis
MELKDQMTISETETTPVVSCIMPTFNRRRFISQAINYFLRQDYTSKELIVVDDGTEVVKDLIPLDDRIRDRKSVV